MAQAIGNFPLSVKMSNLIGKKVTGYSMSNATDYLANNTTEGLTLMFEGGQELVLCNQYAEGTGWTNMGCEVRDGTD